MSPICCKLEHVIWNLKSRHLAHIMSPEEGLGLVSREVPTQVVCNKVVLGVDVGHNRVEFVEDNQIQIFPEEAGHGEVRGLLVGAGQADSHVVHK